MPASTHILQIHGEMRDVAVTMPPKYATSNQLTLFRKEISAVQGLGSHASLAQFVGKVTVTLPLMLISDYYPNGNLRDHLRKVWP